MVYIDLDEQTHHASKRATNKNAGKEKPGRNRCPISDNSHQVPDEEMQKQWVILKDGLLVEQGTD